MNDVQVNMITPEEELKQHLILSYIRFEVIVPFLTKDIIESDSPFNEKGIKTFYECNLKDLPCGMTTPKSCAITASALSMTFLKDIKQWKAKEKMEQKNHPFTYIPWKQGLFSSKNN